MKDSRIIREDVKAVSLWTRTIWLGKDQVFYETEKAWELWEVNGRRLVRWDKKRIYFVHLKID